jgi:BirA family transcriptional regulator, biotin operon repressor / biotin---[acetyl-CoA-carboxylase] ligase
MIPIGEPFIVLPTTESTNIYAMQQVHARLASHGTAYFAIEQTSGKGQRGKRWETIPGQNIIMSVVIDPHPLSPTQQFQLSCIISLGCHDFLKEYVGAETTIKWPNDLYWRDRKAGGILIENIITGNVWKTAIAGIGINVNQTVFDDQLPNPSSLKAITGKNYDVQQMAKTLCCKLQERFVQLVKEKFDLILDEYNAQLYAKNREVRMRKGNRLFNCNIRGVNHKGQLVVVAGIEETFDFGEVEWVI